MKAEEIRTTNFGPANSDTKAVMAVLVEIAAQLAEMNEAPILREAARAEINKSLLEGRSHAKS